MERAYRIERYSSKTFAGILLIILLSITDAYLTLYLISHGAVELNPIMGYYLDHSPLAFFGMKYLLTCGAILLTLVIKDVYLFRARVQGKVMFAFCLIAFGLVVQWELFLVWMYC